MTENAGRLEARLGGGRVAALGGGECDRVGGGGPRPARPLAGRGGGARTSLGGGGLLLRLATKTPSRLVLEVRGDGPLGPVLAEADQEGNLRGMVGNPVWTCRRLRPASWTWGGRWGRGICGCCGSIGEGGSYHSQVELVSGEIGEDVAHYLAQSEQSRSAVLLGVLAKPFGVAAAGGMIVEVLPGADEGVIERLEQNIAGIRGVSQLVEAGGPEHVIETAARRARPRGAGGPAPALPLPVQPRAAAPAPGAAVGRGPRLPARGGRHDRRRLRLLRQPVPLQPEELG